MALDGASLGRCAAVCKLWHELLCRDAGADTTIWKASYLSEYNREPMAREWLGSYRVMYRRAAGLLSLPPPSVLPVAGSAVCFNAATGSVVTFAPRTGVLSVLGPDGAVQTRPAPAADVPAAALGRPLLACLEGDLVVLSTGNGVLQLWDVRSLCPAGILGYHSSPLTSLSADGALVGSTCASELRLWEVDHAAAAAIAEAEGQAPAAAAAQDGAAGDAAAAPAAAAAAAAASGALPWSRPQRAAPGRCLSAVSIGLPMPSPVLEPKVIVCGERRLAALSNCSAPAPSSVVRVYCARPRTAGTLLRELPVNAAADMAFVPGRLLVAAAFHGRSLGGPERAFTVVVHCWDTDTWAWSRLVSPRLSTTFPVTSAHGLPLIHATQEWLLCAVPTRGDTPIPSCTVNAWRLPRCSAAPPSDRDKAVRLRAEQQHGAPSSSSAAAAAQQQARRNGSPQKQQQPAAQQQQQQQQQQRPPVLLVVGDSEGHDPWVPILQETGPGRLAVLTSSPDRLLMATPEGQVRAAAICLAPAGDPY